MSRPAHLTSVVRGNKMINVNFLHAYSLKKQCSNLRPKLFRIAMSWCNNHAIADDITQECLLKGMVKAEQLHSLENMDAWLYRILYNCWQEHLRNKSNQWEELISEPQDQCNPEQELETNDLVSHIRKTIANLPHGQREILTLVDLEELSYKDVAHVLDIPIGTVMSRLCRARKMLRENLNPKKINPQRNASFIHHGDQS